MAGLFCRLATNNLTYTFYLVAWLIPHGSQEQRICFANTPTLWANLQQKDEIIMVEVNSSAAAKWLLRCELWSFMWATKRNVLESPILPQTVSSCHSISRASNLILFSGSSPEGRYHILSNRKQRQKCRRKAWLLKLVSETLSYSKRLFVGF